MVFKGILQDLALRFFIRRKPVVFSNYHPFHPHIPLRQEIYLFIYFVWKKSSDDARIVILCHQRIFGPEAKVYSQ